MSPTSDGECVRRHAALPQPSPVLMDAFDFSGHQVWSAARGCTRLASETSQFRLDDVHASPGSPIDSGGVAYLARLGQHPSLERPRDGYLESSTVLPTVDASVLPNRRTRCHILRSKATPARSQ